MCACLLGRHVTHNRWICAVSRLCCAIYDARSFALSSTGRSCNIRSVTFTKINPTLQTELAQISVAIDHRQRSADNRRGTIDNVRSAVGRPCKSVCAMHSRPCSAIGGWLRERAIVQHHRAIDSDG